MEYKMNTFLAKAESLNHSASTSGSVNPICINKTTISSSSIVIRKHGPSNTCPFVSRAKEKLGSDSAFIS